MRVRAGPAEAFGPSGPAAPSGLSGPPGPAAPSGLSGPAAPSGLSAPAAPSGLSAPAARPAPAGPWARLAGVCGDAWRPGGLELTRRALDWCRFKVPSRLADLGCGPGATLRLLASLGHEAAGVDLDPALAGAWPGLMIAPMEAAPLPGGWADGLFCECALNLARDRAAALGEFWRILRPGGLLVVSDLVDLGPGGRPAGASRPAPGPASDRARVPDPAPGLGPCFESSPAPVGPDPCAAKAIGVPANIEALERAGFAVRLAEDHGPALRRLAAALVWAHGREGLAALAGLGAGPCGAGRRLGYFLFIAEKSREAAAPGPRSAAGEATETPR